MHANHREAGQEETRGRQAGRVLQQEVGGVGRTWGGAGGHRDDEAWWVAVGVAG